MMRRGNKQWGRLILLLLVGLLLAACSTPPAWERGETVEGMLFGDADIDRAASELAGSVTELTGSDEGAVAGGINWTEDEGTSEELSLDGLTTQAVLPNAGGFIAFIRHNPNCTNCQWQLWLANQANDAKTGLYAGNREIESVAVSLDGNTVVFAMKAPDGSNFEVYRLRVSPQEVTRLTTTAYDETNVSMSADGDILVWEGLSGGRRAVFIRQYTGASFSDSVLAIGAHQQQPSVSDDGNFIGLVRPSGGAHYVLLYNRNANSYQTVFGSFSPVAHPSPSSGGEKVAWREDWLSGQRILTRDITTGTFKQLAYSTNGLEHPHLTADGNFLTFGLKLSNSWNIITMNVSSGQLAHAVANVAPVNNHGSYWQKAKPPVITSFTAEPQSINAGEESVLSWEVIGADSLSIDQGVGTVSGTSIAVTPTETTTYTLTAANIGGSATATATVTVTPPAGPASKYVVSASATSVIAGSEVAITAQLADEDDTPVPTAGKTVTWSSTGGGSFSSPTSTTDDSGVATVVFTTSSSAGVSHTVTATDEDDLSGSSESITTQAGEVSLETSTITANPESVTANGTDSATITVQLKDAAGNDLAASAGTVTLSSTAGELSEVTDNSDGTYTATLTAPTTTGVATISGTLAEEDLSDTATVTFTAGELTQFAVEAEGGGDIGAQQLNSPFDIRITAQDAHNNTVDSFIGTVDITSTGTLSSGGGTTAAFTAGVLASHSVSFSNTGSFTITGTRTDGSESGVSNAFTVGGPPTAVDDAYSVPPGSTLNVPGDGNDLFANDNLGHPLAVLTSFGGGSLGGAVASHTPGTTVSPLPGHADGSLTVNGDGSMSFTAPAEITGDLTFEYRIANDFGNDVASVTITPGSPPEAVNDTYDAIGNTLLAVGAAGGLLANDTKPSNPSPVPGTDLFVKEGSVIRVSASSTTTVSGTLVVEEDGSFTYLSPVGETGTEVWEYTVEDSNGTSSVSPGRVEFTINSMVWYVNASAPANGNGTSTHPFQSPASLSGPDAPDGAGDYIYVFSGTYGTGLSLENDQRLIGEGVDLIVGGQTLRTAGTAPTINGAIVLGNDNTVRGLSAEAGMTASGRSGGTFSDLSITNASGAGVSLVSHAGTVTFATSVSITNPSGTAFHLATGTADVSFEGTITQTTSGARGVHLLNNSGGTAAFRGTLTLSTGAVDAFSASSTTTGSRLIVTGANNTLASTAGRGLYVSDVAIGSDGLTFKRIDATGSQHGIFMSGTGMDPVTHGRLVVTGDGTEGSGGTVTGSGTGVAPAAAGLFLSSTRGADLSFVHIEGTTVPAVWAGAGARAIAGTNFGALSLTNSTITGAGALGAVLHTGTATISNTPIAVSHATTTNIRSLDLTAVALTISDSPITYTNNSVSSVGSAVVGSNSTVAATNVAITHTNTSSTNATAFAFSSNSVITGSNIGITATGGNGLSLNGSSWNVTNASINSSGTPLSALGGSSINGSFTAISSNGGTITLNNTSGTFSVADGHVQSAFFLITGGTVSFDWAGDISKVGEGGAAVTGNLMQIQGIGSPAVGHTGTLTFSGNVSQPNGSGLSGLNLTKADGTYNFTGTFTLGGSANIRIVGTAAGTSAGTFNFGTGSSVNSTFNALQVGVATAAVTYGGTLSSSGSGRPLQVEGLAPGATVNVTGAIKSGDFGTSTTGSGIRVLNLAGGAVNVSSPTIELNTGSNTALLIENNPSGTINFAPGSLDIRMTGGGTGISAVRATNTHPTSAAISLTGNNNTIQGAVARPITLENTLIGPAGITFKSLNPTGGAGVEYGIRLLNVSGGPLTVTGDGATPTSGGTFIGHEYNVYLENVSSAINLRHMHLQGPTAGAQAKGAVFGINFGTLDLTGTSMVRTGSTAMSLTNGSLNGNLTSISSTSAGNVAALTGNGIKLDNVGGSFTVGTTTISSPAAYGIWVLNAPAGGSANFGNTTVSGANSQHSIFLSNNAGSIGFGALDITGTNNRQPLVATGNTGAISSTSGTITSPNMTAIEIVGPSAANPTPVNMQLTNVSVVSGGATPIVLINTSGPGVTVTD